MIVEGKNAVREAINSESQIQKIYFLKSSNSLLQQLIDLAKDKKIQYEFVEKFKLDNICKNSNHQGVVAVMEEFSYSNIEDLCQIPNVFLVVLDGIEDPHNFGSIIRVCECMGVDGIIISKNRCCPVNETVQKVSAGAINHMKIAKVTNINNAIEYLKENNIWVYACELGGANLKNFEPSNKIAVVIGSEGKGIAALTKKLCDGIITIEMKGKVNSLNASVATGIVLYQISKYR